MKISKIVVVPKISKYELDMHAYNITSEELMKRYKKEGVDADRIFKSHERQKVALNKLKELLPQAIFVSRNEFTRELANEADLVISFGGDNNFQYLSHFVNGSLILGINSDPLTSVGALTYLDIFSFEKNLDKIKKGDFKVEEWTRLEVNLNGKVLGLALSEVFLGESRRNYLSRHILKVKDKEEEHKCSGLLISTGVGSMGWYNSACRYLFENGGVFSKNEKRFDFLVTEPYKWGNVNYSLLHGTLKNDEEISICSLNDLNGMLSIDSFKDFDFKDGSVAVIKVGKPLRVVSI